MLLTWGGDKISKNKKGVIYSNERNIKIGEKNKGISKNNKAVLQYDLKGNFIKKHTSQTEAARNININHSSGIQAVRLFAFGGALHHQGLFNKLNFKICRQIQKSTIPPLTQIMC